MIPEWVTLEWYEVQAASYVGSSRHSQVLRKGRSSGMQEPKETCSLEAHIMGACGECAFAKAMKMYWPMSIDTFKSEGDVGPYEVRSRRKHWQGLLIHHEDINDRKFVLLTGGPEKFWIRGWVYAGEVKKRPSLLKDLGDYGKECFVVKPELLKKMDTFLLGGNYVESTSAEGRQASVVYGGDTQPVRQAV